MIVAILTGVATAFILLYEPVSGFLARREARHALQQAARFASEGDLDQATLAVRVAATADPANPDIFRVAATVLEQTGDQEALRYRQQLVALFPHNRADRMALIKSALQFGDIASARSALAGLPPDHQDLELQLITASVAVAAGDRTEAEAALAAAAQLDSNDEQIRFRLASAQLHSPDAAVRQTALTGLTKLADGTSPLRWDARRELLRDAAARKQLTEARRWEGEVMANPNIGFEDRVLLLSVEQVLLHRAGTDDLTAAENAAKTPAQVGGLARWLVVTRQSRLAQTWLDRLPDELQLKPAVMSARADVAAEEQDWTKLAALLESGAWGPISREAVRTALTAREMAARNHTELVRGLWNEDLVISHGNLRGLMILNRLAGLWHLEPERRATLEAIANDFPTQRWALVNLLSAFYAEHDTASLARIWTEWGQAHPDDHFAQNDALMITLLRDRGPPTPAVVKKAEQLLRLDPANPFFATTRALCYLREGNAPAAVALFDHMSEVDRQASSRALYYGVALVETKQAGLARAYLAKANVALPEEKALLQSAESQMANLP